MNSKSFNAKKCLIYKPRNEAKISSLTMSWTHTTSAPLQSGHRGGEEEKRRIQMGPNHHPLSRLPGTCEYVFLHKKRDFATVIK